MSLLTIQTELKAPKDQWNDFSKYKYRSCEDIVEAVKPLLLKNKAWLIISDEVVQVGDRIYVKATATITFEKGASVSSTAFAREPLERKGMDASQITGTASSYARKYALNGLLAIDDTKDADTMDKPDPVEPPFELDDDVVTQFEQCENVAALQDIWTALEVKQPYEELKNKAKERLSV